MNYPANHKPSILKKEKISLPPLFGQTCLKKNKNTFINNFSLFFIFGCLFIWLFVYVLICVIIYLFIFCVFSNVVTVSTFFHLFEFVILFVNCSFTFPFLFFYSNIFMIFFVRFVFLLTGFTTFEKRKTIKNLNVKKRKWKSVLNVSLLYPLVVGNKQFVPGLFVLFVCLFGLITRKYFCIL
ncbi:hypothetical protein RFI_19928 [Reticulomyxa filosa]|uniref:Uncharacterized protein n=1 Tax=Reticulomyxa filosa TaxID=46433 RepID=X6MUC3_RETFI|nr:hypothetical protein RFI_19928 [Reticulomyxa filosa]|eukprot:ETO17394.1 hypothetical protein RFI_19928 [Reticulomyxa filosa]